MKRRQNEKISGVYNHRDSDTVLMMGGTGCSTSKTTTLGSPNTTTAAASNTINIVNLTFTPGTLTVKAGTMVTWTNNDSTTHHVASDTGVFDSGNLSPNTTFSYTFNNAGTFLIIVQSIHI